MDQEPLLQLHEVLVQLLGPGESLLTPDHLLEGVCQLCLCLILLLCSQVHRVDLQHHKKALHLPHRHRSGQLPDDVRLVSHHPPLGVVPEKRCPNHSASAIPSSHLTRLRVKPASWSLCSTFPNLPSCISSMSCTRMLSLIWATPLHSLTTSLAHLWHSKDAGLFVITSCLYQYNPFGVQKVNSFLANSSISNWLKQFIYNCLQKLVQKYLLFFKFNIFFQIFNKFHKCYNLFQVIFQFSR